MEILKIQKKHPVLSHAISEEIQQKGARHLSQCNTKKQVFFFQTLRKGTTRRVDTLL
jgi:hypothetical protein